ncbi:hypothetical protein Tco_1006291 [Tanacetum coccineum]|uniref:Uncharacterized protein n=1 Tax=Tanacetum coccineum TaxID=301880 RepID=A0ABQ5FHJ5_9ASTR
MILCITAQVITVLNGVCFCDPLAIGYLLSISRNYRLRVRQHHSRTPVLAIYNAFRYGRDLGVLSLGKLMGGQIGIRARGHACITVYGLALYAVHGTLHCLSIITMSSATSDVTYTSVYTDSEPGRAFWGADYEGYRKGWHTMSLVTRIRRTPATASSPTITGILITGQKNPQDTASSSGRG